MARMPQEHSEPRTSAQTFATRLQAALAALGPQWRRPASELLATPHTLSVATRIPIARIEQFLAGSDLPSQHEVTEIAAALSREPRELLAGPLRPFDEAALPKIRKVFSDRLKGRRPAITDPAVRGHVAANLRRRREALGLSQVEAARRMDISVTSVSKHESVSTRHPISPGEDTLQRYAELYGCTVDELLTAPSDEPMERPLVRVQVLLPQEQQAALPRRVHDSLRRVELAVAAMLRDPTIARRLVVVALPDSLDPEDIPAWEKRALAVAGEMSGRGGGDDEFVYPASRTRTLAAHERGSAYDATPPHTTLQRAPQANPSRVEVAPKLSGRGPADPQALEKSLRDFDPARTKAPRPRPPGGGRRRG